MVNKLFGIFMSDSSRATLEQRAAEKAAYKRQYIVDKCNQLGFADILRWAQNEYSYFAHELDSGGYLPTKRLMFVNSKINERRVDFDSCYFEFLPLEKTNPLKFETQAWELLSPQIEKYVSNFDDYLRKHHENNNNHVHTGLIPYVKNGEDLLKKWKVISESYKTKYREEWNLVEEKENEIKELIREMQLK
jgi:hypothetical protein